MIFAPNRLVEIHQYLNHPSKALGRHVRFDIYLPPIYFGNPNRKFPYVLFNDGQDMEAVQLVGHLEHLYKKNRLRQLVVIAVHAGDRMQEYGTAHRPDYKNRGAKAASYTRYITKELLPFLKRRYRLSANPQESAFAGFSLGGLSALDIAWNNPKTFSKVGIFSGSLWWRSKAFDPENPDADRIAQNMIHNSQYQKGFKFWLQAGTEDETSDRNNNGIIDAIDDTLDLIKALEQLGYKSQRDIKYVEVEGGQHNQGTWSKVLPDFLTWAYGQ